MRVKVFIYGGRWWYWCPCCFGGDWLPTWVSAVAYAQGHARSTVHQATPTKGEPMADNFDQVPGLIVTRFCGPVRNDGGSRTLYQLTSLSSDQMLILTPTQLIFLGALIAGPLHPVG